MFCRAALLSVLLALGGCSSSSTSSGDPGVADSGIPTTPASCPARMPVKTDPYPIAAFVFDSKPGNPFPGAIIEVLNRKDDAVLATATADEAGEAQLKVPSGGSLLDITIRARPPASVADHIPSRVEIQGGFIGKGVQLVVYSAAALQARAQLAGVAWDAGKAVVQVGLSHCNDGTKASAPIEAAAIGVSGGSRTSYAIGNDVFDQKLQLTTAFGGGTDFNTTPGAVTISTVKDGQANTYVTKVEVGVNLFALFQP